MVEEICAKENIRSGLDGLRIQDIEKNNYGKKIEDIIAYNRRLRVSKIKMWLGYIGRKMLNQK